jgi:LysM repeat protein
MGFFSDLAMGFGLKPKTQDFVDRTAKTIARNEGKSSVSASSTASKYLKKETAKLSGTTDTSGSSGITTSVKPKAKPKATAGPKSFTKKTTKSLEKQSARTFKDVAKSSKKKDGSIKVKKGDTLSSLAKKNNTSVAAIAAANPEIKNVNQINVGQDLVIPKDTGEDIYAAGIGASGSGDVTRNKDGSISVATGTKESTELIPVETGGVEPITTMVNTAETTTYKPGQLTESATTAGTATTSTAAAAPQDGGEKKPNIFGYGYYNKQGVWIPPDIDMYDGGGPGISGEVFGSAGGVEADTNNDGYVTKEEAEAAAEKGIFKYGIGAASNAVGATPLGSGKAPTGLAGVVAGGGILGSLMGNEFEPREQMFGPGKSMTQEQVDAYMADVAQRSQEAMEAQQQRMQDDDRQPTEVVAVEDVKPEDPCPEGYKFDAEKGQCVIDPFQTPFPDAPTTTPTTPIGVLPGTVSPSGLSPYTQIGPLTLGQLQPTRIASANPLAMQQAQMPQQGLGTLAPTLNRVV